MPIEPTDDAEESADDDAAINGHSAVMPIQPEVAIPATLPLQPPPPRWADDASMDSDGDGLGVPRPMSRFERLRSRFGVTRHEPHTLPFAERRRLFNGGDLEQVAP